MPSGLIKYFCYKQWGYKKNKATHLTGKVKDKNLTSNIAWSQLEVRIKPWNQKWKLVVFEADKKINGHRHCKGNRDADKKKTY